MNAESIASALGGARRQSNGWMARCPCHDDRNPSLSVTDADDGTVLLKCFADCEQDLVVRAIKDLGLWPDRAQPLPLPAVRKPCTSEIWRPVLPVPADAPPPPNSHCKHGTPSITWRYLSAAGHLLQIVARFNTADGKEVLPLTYYTNGNRKEWRWKALPELRPLYGLELIGEAQHIVIVEGEKATDAARRLLENENKLPVVTWPGGSNATAKTDWAPLAGRNIAIWPDADEPGIKAAIAVAEHMEGLGCTVKIVDPPDSVAKGWDLADAEGEGWTGQQVRETLRAALTVEDFRARHTPAPVDEMTTCANPVGEPPMSSRLKVVDIVELLSLQFPPRENLLSPWLPQQGLCMVYAPRGIGKTHFSLGVSYAAASGGTFLKWTATKPRGVLFLDGEMPGVVLQERLARIATSSEKEPTAPLRIITPDLQPSGMLNLSDPVDQASIDPFLDGIDLIVVDNLSTLCRSGKEAEGESWLPVQQWALQQRAAGRSVLFIHHSGKNGEQRGTSRREDVLDTVIALRRPGDYAPDKGASFEVHFEKARGIYGDDTKPFEASLVKDNDCRQSWVMKDLEASTAEKVAKLLTEGVAQGDIGEMLGITKGAVSKAKKRAQETGLLA